MKINYCNSRISSYLLEWYKEHGRDLPWRRTSDPYKIWLSEVILQQTRVAQGKEYYFRFIEKFPTVETLASSDENEVLKVWQGLGYYTRARNLHTASKQIMTNFNGTFPNTYSDIISLKGVGVYTASAIASIAFNEPYAVVDGNVYRVISRLFTIGLSIHSSDGKKIISEIAQTLLTNAEPGKYNQAIMDFGALICTPALPKCHSCILQHFCMAFAEKRVGDFPVNDRIKSVKKRYFNYFHIEHNGSTFLQRRNGSDIWKNLFEFPLIETSGPVDFVDLRNDELLGQLFSDVPTLIVDLRLNTKHQLTHQTIFTRFYRIVIPDEISFSPPKGILKIENEQLPDFPVSRLTHKYLETI